MASVSASASVPSRTDLRSSIDLFVTLVERDLRLRSKRAMFGLIWPATAPLFLLALYVYVFRRVFNVPIPDYPVFLFAGLLPWTFLAQSLGKSLESLSRQPELIRRSRFAYELIPLASVAGSGVFFLATLVGFIAYLGVARGLAWELLPLLLLPLTALWLFVSAVAVVLALVDVYNRDLRSVLGNILTVWFFLAPVVYRQQMAPKPMQSLRSIDPMNMIIGQFRDILYHGQISRPAHLVLMFVTCTVAFAVAIAVFRRAAPALPREV